jgi:hypothetical protein
MEQGFQPVVYFFIKAPIPVPAFYVQKVHTLPNTDLNFRTITMQLAA